MNVEKIEFKIKPNDGSRNPTYDALVELVDAEDWGGIWVLIQHNGEDIGQVFIESRARSEDGKPHLLAHVWHENVLGADPVIVDLHQNEIYAYGGDAEIFIPR